MAVIRNGHRIQSLHFAEIPKWFVYTTFGLLCYHIDGTLISSIFGARYRITIYLYKNNNLHIIIEFVLQ